MLRPVRLQLARSPLTRRPWAVRRPLVGRRLAKRQSTAVVVLPTSGTVPTGERRLVTGTVMAAQTVT